MAKVYGRMVASKKSSDSITERESDRFVEASLTSDFHTITVFGRADGRATVEVKAHGRLMVSLNLNPDGTLLAIGGNVIDGKAL